MGQGQPEARIQLKVSVSEIGKDENAGGSAGAIILYWRHVCA